MEFFKNPNINWMGRKWYFIALSLLLTLAGMVSLLAKGGPRYGIDFRGGVLVQVKFKETPDLERLRAALRSQGIANSTLQQFGPESDNELLIGLDLQGAQEGELGTGQQAILRALRTEFGAGDGQNWNEASEATIAQLLESEAVPGLPPEQIQSLAERLVQFRDAPPQNGLVGKFEDLNQVAGVTPQVLQTLRGNFSMSPFAVRNVEVVGPKVGAELRHKAVLATLLGLASVLIYVALRFEWIYGVAAILAIFHDVIITVGFLSIANMEVTLTVIAALLTLVGYSVNDTIVVFDRIRENVRLMRRASITEIADCSINQTLSRTVLTSGLTFSSVLALFLFGGEALRGFSFTLVVGILVGTYSSISVASTIVVCWQEYANRHRVSRAVRGLDKPQKDRLKVGARV